jgi:hypothetical protein
MLRVLLELIRIILIIAFLGTFFGYLFKTVYTEFGIYNEQYEWPLIVGIYILIFVLFRNKFQFSGWYNGKGSEKLPKRATRIFFIIFALLILSPAFLYFFHIL